MRRLWILCFVSENKGVFNSWGNLSDMVKSFFRRYNVGFVFGLAYSFFVQKIHFITRTGNFHHLQQMFYPGIVLLFHTLARFFQLIAVIGGILFYQSVVLGVHYGKKPVFLLEDIIIFPHCERLTSVTIADIAVCFVISITISK